MSDIDNDPVLRRAVEELRQLPSVDPAAIRRVVGAAAAARVAPADEPAPLKTARDRSIRLWTVAGVAAAAAIVGFIARGALTPQYDRPASEVAVRASAPASPPAVLRSVLSADSDVLPISQQFVFDNRSAHRISVVGDFNKWNPASAPMTRSSDGTLWSVIIPVLPGRHTYGFMVDDSIFTLDPRQPRVRDPELGTEGSVVIVGRP
jgi:hypothetical protein